MLVNLGVLLVPPGVRNALQHPAAGKRRRFDDPDQGKAEVAPVPAMRVARAFLPRDEEFLVLRRAIHQRLAGHLLQDSAKRGRTIERADETAVFGDVFAGYDAHPARRIVGSRETEVAPLRVLGQERQHLLANGRADAVRYDIAHYDEPVAR